MILNHITWVRFPVAVPFDFFDLNIKKFMISFDIITIFPKPVEDFIKEGLFRIALDKKIVDINVHDLRNWTSDKHKTVDDRPFGGGAGMLLKIEPIYKAINDLKREGSEIWVTDAGGEIINQQILHVRKDLAIKKKHVILIAGHYEGIDYRVLEHLATWTFSIGSFILSGGELPILVLLDGLIRLLPGVLGNPDSLKEESFEESFLEYPQYTRPENFNGLRVPEVLLSGNHKLIKEWREKHKRKIN